MKDYGLVSNTFVSCFVTIHRIGNIYVQSLPLLLIYALLNLLFYGKWLLVFDMNDFFVMNCRPITWVTDVASGSFK